MRDWWISTDPKPCGNVAWVGENAAVRAQRGKIRLFKLAWKNLLPAVAVDRIDYLATRKHAAPFLIAITLE